MVDPLNGEDGEVGQGHSGDCEEAEGHDVDPDGGWPEPVRVYGDKDLFSCLDQTGDVLAEYIANHDCNDVYSACGITALDNKYRKNPWWSEKHFVSWVAFHFLTKDM